MHSAALLRSIAAILLFSFSLLLFNMPVSQAIDPVKITLPAITDKSGYRNNELNAALLTKLRSQFRFPKYEILTVAALNRDVDRPLLEKLATDNAADGTRSNTVRPGRRGASGPAGAFSGTTPAHSLGSGSAAAGRWHRARTAASSAPSCGARRARRRPPPPCSCGGF